MTKIPLISVLIPAYNAEDYIIDCIKSVEQQSYQQYEILVVDDGSTDGTLDHIKALAAYNNKIKYFVSQNKGQGFQRNYLINQAQGEFIIFLDADDFLEPHTFELALNRILSDSSDFVNFNWKYYYPLTEKYVFNNKEIFSAKSILKGDECLDLLATKNYFSVPRLYRTSFLKDNLITFGEGYFYEDFEFFVKTALATKLVSLMDMPLYNVRVSTTSVTKTQLTTDIHYQGFISASKKSIDIINQSTSVRKYYLYVYLIRKYFQYHKLRIPHALKQSFTVEFVELLSKEDIVPIKAQNDASIRFLVKFKAFKKKRIYLLNLIHFYFEHLKPIVQNMVKIMNNFKKRLKIFVKRIIRRPLELDRQRYFAEYEKLLAQDIALSKTILMLGFDFKYIGNSKYLFEQLKPLAKSKFKLYFATTDKVVEKKYRVEPNSKRFYQLFAQASIVIFESWYYPYMTKRVGSLWIQLWHGTPIKRVLFDSTEFNILKRNPNHKIMRFNSISNWDILISDNPNVNKYFINAFQISPTKIFATGYPRVKYLLNNFTNKALIKDLKIKNSIPTNKKIVLYIPTWRDYNYNLDQEKRDTNYLLDLLAINKLLGEDYYVINKDHAFLPGTQSLPSNNLDVIETQDLLLLADYLITDYSSILFDALAINLPIYLYVNDFNKYNKVRGVYEDMWDDFHDFIFDDITTLATAIKADYQPYNYQAIKDNYAINDRTDSLINLIDTAIEDISELKNALLIIDVTDQDKLFKLLDITSKYYENITIGLNFALNEFIENNQHADLLVSFMNNHKFVEITSQPIASIVQERKIFTVVTSKKNYLKFYAQLKDKCKVIYVDLKSNQLKENNNRH